MVVARGFFAVQGEGVLALFNQSGIVTVQLPVSALNGTFDFFLRFAHVDTVVNAGSISNDKRRSVVGFRFRQSLYKLSLTCAHTNLCHVHVSVGHCHHAKVLFLDTFARSGKFRNCACGRRLACLSACVGVHFGVQYQNVYVFAACQHVVKSAVADVVSPAVATENPHGFLNEAILFLQNFLYKSVCIATAVCATFKTFHKVCSGNFACFGVVFVGNPSLAGVYAFFVSRPFFGKSVNLFHKACSALNVSKVDTVTEFGIVFKQTVCPGRSVSVFVHGIGTCGGRTAVDGRTSRSVSNNHSVAEQLRYKFNIRCFATSCASAGEFKQRLFELTSLCSGGVERTFNTFHRLRELVVGNFHVVDLFRRNHHKSLFLCGANVSANTASRAVQRADLHAELCSLHTDCRFCGECFGQSCVFVNQNGTDNCMGASHGALCALNTLVHLPRGKVDGNATFFVLCSCCGHNAAFVECRNGKAVALLFQNRTYKFFKVLAVRLFGQCCAFGGGSPFCGNLHLVQTCNCAVDSGKVSVDNLLSFFAVGLDYRLFHVFFRLFVGDDVGKFEECRLHYHVCGFCRTCFQSNVQTVNGVELQMLLRNLVLHVSGQFLFQFCVVPSAVEKECAAVFCVCKYVVVCNVTGVVAGNKFRLVDEVTGFDGVLAETQVRNGKSAGLFAVVFEVALCIQISVVADNFDAVLVCANRTVAAQSVKFATCCACGGNVDDFRNRQRSGGYVVGNADGEVVFLFSVKIAVDCQNHGRSKFLASQAVTSAQNGVNFSACFGKSGNNVKVQGFAKTSGFLCSVKHCNFRNCFGKSIHEVLCGERTVEVYFQYAHFFPSCVEVVNGFFNGFCAATHDNDNLVGVFCSDVVKQMVVSACKFAHFFHVLFNDCGCCKVVLVCRFSVLEVDVCVLSSTLKVGMFGVQGTCTEFVHVLHVKQFCHVFVGNFVNFGNFVTCTETVKEVQERHLCFQRGKVCHQSHVHCFLNGVACQQCKTCLTACHYVLVIAKNVQSVSRQRSCRYVEHAGQKFAADFVHVGNHQKQALAGSECGCQCACHKTSVKCACCASFRLHFGNSHRLSKQVFSALGSPFVGNFRHGRRRSYWVDCRNIAESISNVRGSSVTVNCSLCHYCLSSNK